MSESTPPPFRAPARLRWVLTLSGALLAAGCAPLPPVSSPASVKTPGAFATANSFESAAAQWPVEAWWTTYGDRQLDTLVDEALRDAPDLQAASARLRRADAFTLVADSPGRPQVSANAGVSAEKLSENHLVPRSPSTEGWNDYGRATLDLRWDLDFWGRIRAGLAAATSEQQARHAELAQARLVLASGIATDYAELSHLFAQRGLAQQSVVLRGKTAELFSQRHGQGLETRGSVRAADAARAAAEGALLAVEEQIALQRHRLAALLGKGPDRGLAIEPPQLKLARAFGLPGELAVNLLGRRPDVVAARLLAQAQADRIDEKTAEFYPNVNLSAFVGLQSLGLDRLVRSGSAIGSVGPAISLPLFSGGRLQGELRGAHASHAESVARYDATVARALQEVADAAVSQRALGARLAKAQEAVDAATEAHRVARDRYEGGLASYLEVLSAQDGLLASLGQQTQLRARSLALDITLNRALGGGYQASPSSLAQAR